MYASGGVEMAGSTNFRCSVAIGVLSFAIASGSGLFAATKYLDLDGNPANGAESQCDLNVLQTFPVMVESRVTNRAVGDSYTFSWPSAGPGGFTSSMTPGSTGGVGVTWTWTTNQSVFAFTGGSCSTDVCFTKTAGSDAIPNYCSLACLADGTAVTIAKSATAGAVTLNWAGGQGAYTVYRSSSSIGAVTPANVIGTTAGLTFTETAPSTDAIDYYVVRGVDCTTRKTCTSDASCANPGDGTCISRGPFGVPGRSLFTNDVTVSAGSLTSSLITFFSPPKEVFRVTSSVAPGGAYQQSVTNTSTQPVTVTVAGYPAGCCEQPHQINCDGQCFNYLTDPANCGGCGVVCDEGSYCSEGTCLSYCPEGTENCGGICTDTYNDPNNCGECGLACNSGGCEGAGACSPADVNYICTEGTCVLCQPPADHACDNQCTDISSDLNNCGGCGISCTGVCANGSSDNFCGEGACVCISGPGDFSSGPAGRIGAPRSESGPNEAPICETPPSVTVVPVGATSTTPCQTIPFLAKEITTSALVCGAGMPDGQARCPDGSTASRGTVNKLVPDLTKPIGAAAVSPYAVHVTDPSNDGLIQPGETVSLLIDVLNAGPTTISNASATLISDPVDLSDDGVANPVALTVSTTAKSFGNILGTVGSCDAPATIHPATNTSPFQVTVPSNHPGDTSRPFVLRFTGTVAGSPFNMDMPIALGIAGKCDATAATRAFDGLTGLFSPMAKLVPKGDAVQFPSSPVETLDDGDDDDDDNVPLALKMSCGGVNLTGNDVDAPQIVGLSEASRGVLDITTLHLNGDAHDDLSVDPNYLFFKYKTSSQKWTYNMNTSHLGHGTFTLTIRIAGRKDYVTGFVLQHEH
jgi:hypothetical protein